MSVCIHSIIYTVLIYIYESYVQGDIIITSLMFTVIIVITSIEYQSLTLLMIGA